MDIVAIQPVVVDAERVLQVMHSMMPPTGHKNGLTSLLQQYQRILKYMQPVCALRKCMHVPLLHHVTAQHSSAQHDRARHGLARRGTAQRSSARHFASQHKLASDVSIDS